MKKSTREWVQKAEADHVTASGGERMCLDESSVLKLSYRNTFSEVMELNKYAPEVRLKGYMTFGIGVIVLLVGSITLLFNHDDSKWILLLWSVGLCFMMGIIVTRLAGLGAWIRSSRPLLSFEFSLVTALVKIDDEAIELGWESCGYFYETPNLIVLRVPGDSFAIPKRAGGSDDILLLLRLLKKKLPTRPPSWRWYLT